MSINIERPEAEIAEKTISTQEIYKGSIIRVRLDEVTLPNNAVRKREVVEHPGGAVVMAILPDGRFLLVKQYRYPLGHLLYEFPAGKLDPGEMPAQSIRRELEEETGYLADHWEELTSVYTSPGFCNERITLFKATGLHPAPNPQREEDEFIDVLAVTQDELFAMVSNRQIIDAKTLCALWFLEH